MRKIIIVLLMILLTGCISENNKKMILTELEEKNYLSSSWVLFQEESEKEGLSDIQTTKSYDYIYKDGNKYNVVSIYNSNNEEKYNVNIYLDVNYPKNGNIYEYGKIIRLELKKENGLFSKSWIINEII